MTMRKASVLLLLIFVLALALAALGCRSTGQVAGPAAPKAGAGGEKATGEPGGKGPAVPAVGAGGTPSQETIVVPPSLPESKNAKVVVQAFFPLNKDHKEEVEAVRGLEKKFLGKVRTEVYEMRKPDEKPEDFKKWTATGLGCAGIIIDGKNEFTVDTGDGKGPHKVMFQRAMGGAWTQVELEKAVADEVQKIYAGK
jgi:hypothetical protein